MKSDFHRPAGVSHRAGCHKTGMSPNVHAAASLPLTIEIATRGELFQAGGDAVEAGGQPSISPGMLVGRQISSCRFA